MEILSYEESDTFIVLRNRDGGQVVRLFFNVNATHVCLMRLYIVPTYRKQGWARMVIQRVIEKYKDKSFITNAFADKDQEFTSEQLISFMRSFGFKIQRLTEEGVLLTKP